MNKVCPSFCSEVFMELALQFFSGTQHGVRGPCGVVYDRFTPKMGKIGQAQGSLNVQESSVFSQFFIFLSVWSIMKVCITVILLCLNTFHTWEVLVSGIWTKMLWANQIAGFFNESQYSKISLSHKEINEINWVLVCTSNSFLRNGSLVFSDFWHHGR